MKKNILILYLLFLSNAAVFANPIITETETFYEIRGKTADELRAQMTMLGPTDQTVHVDATTIWTINWEFHDQYDNPSQNPCYYKSADIHIVIKQLYPKWVNMSDGDPELQMKWNAYLTKLRAHEKAHADNEKSTGYEIENASASVLPMPDCFSLFSELDTIANQIKQKHIYWDAQYDATTDHGKKDGVVFP